MKRYSYCQSNCICLSLSHAEDLQPCGPHDNYALLYYTPKMTWEQVGQDYNEAVRRRAGKEQELLQKARERSAQTDTTPKAPSSLEEFRNAFLASKRKERKKDRTPLDPDTRVCVKSLRRSLRHSH